LVPGTGRDTRPVLVFWLSNINALMSLLPGRDVTLNFVPRRVSVAICLGMLTVSRVSSSLGPL